MNFHMLHEFLQVFQPLASSRQLTIRSKQCHHYTSSVASFLCEGLHRFQNGVGCQDVRRIISDRQIGDLGARIHIGEWVCDHKIHVLLQIGQILQQSGIIWLFHWEHCKHCAWILFSQCFANTILVGWCMKDNHINFVTRPLTLIVFIEFKCVLPELVGVLQFTFDGFPSFSSFILILWESAAFTNHSWCDEVWDGSERV